MEFILVFISFIVDLIIGDPSWFPHPVRWMGKMISFFDLKLRRSESACTQKIKGMLMAVAVVSICGMCSFLLIKIAVRINLIFGYIVWVYIAYTTIAVKDLFLHAKAVLKGLDSSISVARRKLSYIVGRDTSNLSEEKVVSAVIESVAENTADGIISPLFYLFMGGPVLAICYKAVNTLDSMVGYKNEEYINFGWFAAKLDDIANYIPARITGMLIVAAAFFLKKDTNNSFIIMLRDKNKHSSPNSAVSEAAMAGALGLRIAGPCAYKGVNYDYPYIGDEVNKLNRVSISEAIKISFLTSVLMIILGGFFCGLFRI